MPLAIADSGYGDAAAFRLGLTASAPCNDWPEPPKYDAPARASTKSSASYSYSP